MAHYTIDRFEGSEWAVLEDERARTFTVPRKWLPSEAREGDVLSASEQDAGDQMTSLRFELDLVAREERLEKARRLREELPRGPKGNITL